MYRYIFLIYVIFFNIYLYADSKCSNINILNNIGGNVTTGDIDIAISCSSIKREEIDTLLKDIKKINTEIKKEKSFNNLNINIYKKKLLNLNQKLSKNREEMLILIKRINKYNSKLHQISIEKIEEVKIANNISIIRIDEIDKKITTLEYQLQSIDIRSKTNSDKIKQIVKNKSDKFYGASFSGITINNSDSSGYIGAVEVEKFNKDNDSSLFASLSSILLMEEIYYETLGEEIESVNNDKNIYALEIGYRKFFDIGTVFKNSKIYLGTSFGHTLGGLIGDEEELLFSLFMGFEYYNKSDNKLIFEIGSKYFNNMCHHEVHFNPLGESEEDITEYSEFSGFISLKFLWR